MGDSEEIHLLLCVCLFHSQPEIAFLLNVQVVKETIDASATIEYRPNTADDPHKRKPDISKAKELLNWEPKISLREGLPLMVSDFQNRILNEDEGKGLK